MYSFYIPSVAPSFLSLDPSGSPLKGGVLLPCLSSLIRTACILFLCGLARLNSQGEVIKEQEIEFLSDSPSSQRSIWSLSCPWPTSEQGV